MARSHPTPNTIDTRGTHAVSVRSLIAFAARTGSIERGFTPAPTGTEGTEGHVKVARNRPASYQTEISLSIQIDSLTLRGRADGYSSSTNCLEEIKTFYGDFRRIADNQRQLHWAQAKCYGWMLCRQAGLDSIRLALVYFHLKEEKEYRVEQDWTLDTLEQDCLTMVEKYQSWQARTLHRQTALRGWASGLPFPFSVMHPSQRQMAEAVYKSVATGRVLLAEAPTGTGKTLAGLFPAIKAMAHTHVDRVFYLTAKSTGKQIALDALHQLAGTPATPLRVLELTAQAKACLAPESQCTGESCPYAEKFFDKLVQARAAAADIPVLDQAALRTLAETFRICPVYLGMEMCRWVDVVVADVNYYFDGSPLLLQLADELDWKPCLLVDECHNLIERGRMMYSAALDRRQLLDAIKLAVPPLKTVLTRLNRHWLALLKTLVEHPGQLTLIDEIPPAFLHALKDFTDQYREFLQHNPEPGNHDADAQSFFLAALAFQSRMTEKNDDFCIDMGRLGTRSETLTLRNLVPAQLLHKRLARAGGASFFSATLRPMDFYHRMLGLPEDTVHLQVDSPFAADQLAIRVAADLSTRYRDRSASLHSLVACICEQLQQTPGNALLYFSSYAYLLEVDRALSDAVKPLGVEIVRQEKSMSESDRMQFIDQFNTRNNLLGLAVLGGALGEGIDLPGDALKGVFIATLGLPQVNSVNEYLKHFLQSRFQQGYRYSYLYPGIQKVVQAAGRVIRRTGDTGYVYLLDERYQNREVRQLLPSWWRYQG